MILTSLILIDRDIKQSKFNFQVFTMTTVSNGDGDEHWAGTGAVKANEEKSLVSI